MSKRITITEARDQLPELVEAAEQGEIIELTREGRPVAVLVSLQEYRSTTSNSQDLWSAIQEFRRTHDLSDLDIEEVYAGVRDPSPDPFALAMAPERIHDPECPYDPNDPAAVEAFWKNATVHRPAADQERKQRAPNKPGPTGR